MSCAQHHAHSGFVHGEHSAFAVYSFAVVLILCLSPFLPPLPPDFSPFFSYTCSSFSLHCPSIFFLLFSSLISSLCSFGFLPIRCPNDFTGDRCQTYVMASFYRMSTCLFCLCVRLPSCDACTLGVERLHSFPVLT